MEAATLVIGRRLRSPLSVAMAVVVLAVASLAVRVLVEHPPRRDFMTTFATVDVGMLVVLAVEHFAAAPRLSTNERGFMVAIRISPLATALLLALYGVTAGGHMGADASKILAVGVFVGTAVGVLSVVFAAIDRATHS